MGIALDIIDALAEETELGVSELARRLGIAKSTAHRTCAVLAAAGPARPHRRRGATASGCDCVEYGGLATRAHGGPGPRSAAARRAAQHPRRDGPDRGAGGRRRRLRRARRGAAGPALLDQRPAVADPPVERRQGPRRVTTRRWSRPGCAPACRRAPATRSSCPSCSSRSSTGSATVATPAVSTRPRSGCPRSPCRCTCPLDGPVVAAISMIGPTTRLIGDHEAHHVERAAGAAPASSVSRSRKGSSRSAAGARRLARASARSRHHHGWIVPSRLTKRPEWASVSPSTSATISAAAGPGSSSWPRGVAMAVRRSPGWRATAIDPVVAQPAGELDGDHVQRRLRRHVADVAPDRGGDLHRADGRGHVHDPRPATTSAADPSRARVEQHRAEGVDADLVEERARRSAAARRARRPGTPRARPSTPALLISTSSGASPTAAANCSIDASDATSRGSTWSVSSRSSSAVVRPAAAGPHVVAAARRSTGRAPARGRGWRR